MSATRAELPLGIVARRAWSRWARRLGFRLGHVFNLSGSEIIVILLLALVVLGPEKLPDAMRRAGKTYAELKKLSSGFQDEVRKGFEEPIREVKETAAAVRSAARFPVGTSATSDDKPRYNPARDPAPKHSKGSSVAEPTSDRAADASESIEPAEDAADVEREREDRPDHVNDPDDVADVAETDRIA